MKSSPMAWISACVISGIMASSISPLGTVSAQSPQTPPRLSAEELQTYEKARTVIDWTPKETHVSKGLKNLRAARCQARLDEILQKVGERVAAFVNDFPNTTSTEGVHSDRLDDKHGSVTEVFEERFRYLLLRNPQGGWNGFQEYRTDAQGHMIDYNTAKVNSILTSRFALMVLYFDPHIQWSCRFRYFGRQTLGRHETDVVGFAQNPEANVSLAMFRDGERTVQTLFQGLAWIDVGSHEILRLRTDLLAPPPHSPLERETTRVDYAPVHLSETSAAIVLPKEVVVDLWLRMDANPDLPSFQWTSRGLLPPDRGPQVRHYHNTHGYSDYKLFRVESRIGPTP